ncbi:MAG TPA: tetratricopeptide repeat protein [Chitinophagaceae bacterium]|nr:tetratricopeptide repeat protein [Chitinophagaceae bacterium]
MAKNINEFLILIMFVHCSTFIFSQSGNPSISHANTHITDSLLTLLKVEKEDSNKVDVLNALGSNLRAAGKLENALEYENTAILLARKINYKKGEGQAFGNMGLMLADLGKYAEARESHNKALSIREGIGDKKGAGNSYTNLGHIFFDEGNFDSALYMYRKCLKIREETSDEQGIADCNNNIGNVHQKQGNYAEALKCAKNALAVREKIKDYNGIASSYGNIGIIYKELGKYNEALQSYFSSLKLAETIGDKKIMANAFGNIGNVYSLQGNLPEALKNQLESLKIKKEMGYKMGISISCDNIGVLYAKQENFSEALKYFQQASKINDELGDKFGQVYNFTNFGGAYYEQAKILIKKNQNRSLIEDKLDSSLKYFKDALSISLQIGNKKGSAMSYYNLGNVYREKEDYNAALKNDSAALKIFKAIGEKYGTAMTHNAFGDVFIKMSVKNNSKQNYNNASQNLNKSLHIAEEIGSKELIRSIYESFAELYNVSMDYKRALDFTNLYYALRDSILNKQSLQKMEGLRLQYEVEMAKTDEKNRQEKIQAELLFAFAKREDSLKYEQDLIQEQLKQQTLLAKQQEQSLLLQQTSLELSNKQNELSRLGYLRSQTQLEAEQIRREEKEKELTIANQEKSLQSSRLSLQQTQINLKESQIQAERKQRLFYIAGIILLLLLFVIIYRNIQNNRRSERLIAAERLKSENANAANKMTELELQSLRAQLNPHFMFNSLNAIQELILKEDNDNSHLYLSRFSELLRMLLDNANQPFVSLRKEISLLELYLSLENLRIPDLKYTIEIDPGIDSNRMAIPNMMLQPYIENAIWHGLSHKKGERNLNIRISRKGENVVCEVEDNGVGRKLATELKSLYRKEHRSRGMELLSRRFNLLSKEYGADIQTTIEDLHDNGKATGTRVAITVPYSITEQAKPVYS